MNKRKAGSILFWISSVAFTCAMSICLLMMIASSVAISFAGLSRIVGLVIAGAGLIGCVALLLIGGAAIVAAVTVIIMRKTDRPAVTAQGADAASVEPMAN
jgi:hypothetical protein